MKIRLFLLFFAILVMASAACKRKCAYCEKTLPGGSMYGDYCRKDFDSKAEWEAAVKLREDLGFVCTIHR